MAVTACYAMPHPPLAVPFVGDESKGAISKTLAAFDNAAAEIESLKPDTIIFITPHNINYADYFHISPGEGASGDFSRFGAAGATLIAEYDSTLSESIAACAEEKGIQAGFLGEKNAALDHGAMVPMWFINSRYKGYKTVRISQSGLDRETHYRFGQAIAEACAQADQNVVIIASGDMSHKLCEGGGYGFSPEGAVFDGRVVSAFVSADFLSLLKIEDTTRESASECGYNSYLIMAGALDRLSVESRVLSYEGPFGVGYLVAAFMPGEFDGGRNVLDQYLEFTKAEANASRISEDAYRRLARRSLEHTVKSGRPLSLSAAAMEELPGEMKGRAGVFVSLHKNGRLRGCIGTILPVRVNIAEEIARNAVSAGLNDDRFEQVTADELPYITYKVNVLEPPEPIDSPNDLDAKRYGVIVTSGFKRGLLLPGLDGIDTAERQIEIARKKGGIGEGEDITLQRFLVTRHE